MCKKSEPLGIVQQPGGFIQRVEMIPLVFERADSVGILIHQTKPVIHVELESKYLIEVLFPLPMLQARAIEEHHRAGVKALWPTAD